MIALLRELKKKVVIGFVGGSDLAKITEQLEPGEFQPRVMIPVALNSSLFFEQLSTTSIMHLLKTA
jgi:hypothetical protein